MAYNNYNNNGGGYNNNQRGNYQQGNGGYQQNNRYNQAPQPPQNPEDFINERVDIYTMFVDAIKAKGLDPADFAFALGGWVTSFVLGNKGK